MIALSSLHRRWIPSPCQHDTSPLFCLGTRLKVKFSRFLGESVASFVLEHQFNLLRSYDPWQAKCQNGINFFLLHLGFMDTPISKDHHTCSSHGSLPLRISLPPLIYSRHHNLLASVQSKIADPSIRHHPHPNGFGNAPPTARQSDYIFRTELTHHDLVVSLL